MWQLSYLVFQISKSLSQIRIGHFRYITESHRDVIFEIPGRINEKTLLHYGKWRIQLLAVGLIQVTEDISASIASMTTIFI